MERFGDKVTYLALPDNIGFGVANNEGFKVARGRNIFFLNPDTVLLNNAVEILSDYLDKHEKIGAVGANLYTPEMGANRSFELIMPSIAEELDMLFSFSRVVRGSSSFFNNTDTPKKVAFIIGADLMIRREVLEKIGGFDKRFFMDYEETELQYRLAKSGFQIYNVPSAKIIHLEGGSFGVEISERRISTYEKSRLIYFSATNRGRLYIKIANFFHYLMLWRRCYVFRAGAHSREYWLARLQIFKSVLKECKI